MAYVLVIPDCSLRGDAYASGEPEAANAWVIVPPAVGGASDPRIRVFPTDSAAREWRDRRIAYQRALGRRHAWPMVLPVDAARVAGERPRMPAVAEQEAC